MDLTNPLPPSNFMAMAIPDDYNFMAMMGQQAEQVQEEYVESQKRPVAIPKHARSPYTRTACFTCREKHQKCEGQRPVCLNCLNKGLDCVYRQDRKKRTPLSREEMVDNALVQEKERLTEELEGWKRKYMALKKLLDESLGLRNMVPQYTFQGLPTSLLPTLSPTSASLLNPLNGSAFNTMNTNSLSAMNNNLLQLMNMNALNGLAASPIDPSLLSMPSMPQLSMPAISMASSMPAISVASSMPAISMPPTMATTMPAMPVPTGASNPTLNFDGLDFSAFHLKTVEDLRNALGLPPQ